MTLKNAVFWLPIILSIFISKGALGETPDEFCAAQTINPLEKLSKELKAFGSRPVDTNTNQGSIDWNVRVFERKLNPYIERSALWDVSDGMFKFSIKYNGKRINSPHIVD